MTLSFWIWLYVNAALLLSGCAVIGIILQRLNQRYQFLAFREEHRLHHFLLLSFVVVLGAQRFLPKDSLFRPVAKIWTAGSVKQFPLGASLPEAAVTLGAFKGSVPLEHANSSLLILLTLLVGSGLALYLRERRKLSKILDSALPYKQRGAIRIYLSKSITVPFSFWEPQCHGVILPFSLLGTHRDFRMALSHELQHLRQGDTQTLYAFLFFKALFFWNPLLHLWSHAYSEVQEFACDEALIGRQSYSSTAYAHCLLHVAENSRSQKQIRLDCATGLLFLMNENLLKRRIQKMFQIKTSPRSLRLTLAACALTVLGGLSYASKGLIQDRRVSLEEAQKMALTAKAQSQFPITMNELVLRELNRFLGTPEGRQFIQDGLERMESHKTLIQDKLKEYQLPEELLAVPLVESGYRNLTQDQIQAHGAGIWMFIKSTARRYGLVVNEQHDERLNVAAETDAAMRLLGGDHLQFKDWNLAVLSYNIGSTAVGDAIEKYNTRNAWDLVRSGTENDRQYLAKVMAVIIIMKNPSSLN